MNNLLFRLGSLNVASSIIISAIGGHKPWEIDRKITFQKGFDLHLSSGIGMILCSYRNSYVGILSGLLLLAGSGLFSGLIYHRCFKDDKKYNYLMPYGGGSMILGWILLAFS